MCALKIKSLRNSNWNETFWKSEKFDKNAEYIKEWIPELRDVPAKDIHNWESKYKDYDLNDINYFKPIVEYKKARKESVEMYRKVL